MTKILLSYDTEYLKTAENLKRDLEELYGFSVSLVDEEEESFEESAEAEIIRESDLLLVLHFEHSNISAWILTDKPAEKKSSANDADDSLLVDDLFEDKRKSSFYTGSLFPDTIDFSNYAKGMAEFCVTLTEDYGVVLDAVEPAPQRAVVALQEKESVPAKESAIAKPSPKKQVPVTSHRPKFDAKRLFGFFRKHRTRTFSF